MKCEVRQARSPVSLVLRLYHEEHGEWDELEEGGDGVYLLEDVEVVWVFLRVCDDSEGREGESEVEGVCKGVVGVCGVEEREEEEIYECVRQNVSISRFAVFGCDVE